MAMTPEELYLLFREQTKRIDYLELKFSVIERFVKEQNPEYFAPSFEGDAGELGVADDLNPICFDVVQGKGFIGKAFDNAEKGR
jgi:hypothetical protein